LSQLPRHKGMSAGEAKTQVQSLMCKQPLYGYTLFPALVFIPSDSFSLCVCVSVSASVSVCISLSLSVCACLGCANVSCR